LTAGPYSRVPTTSASGVHRSASTGRIVAAFAAIYIVWGSTYLAIRFAIETLPPFLMAGTRFLVAGALLYAYARARGIARPSAVHWRSATIVGGFLLLGGNGGVVWAEQHVASGIAALLVATVPVWMVLFDWLRPGGARPGRGVLAGLVLGMAGIAILVGPAELAGSGRIHAGGAAVLVMASLFWAVGSIWSRHLPLPRPTLAIAMEMVAGGALLLAFATLVGEPWRLDPGAASLRSVLALLYLIVFGSLIGFTAYIWLLGVVSAARVSTYAFVNPVVAVFLGWALAAEPITVRVLLAAAVIIAAVMVITLARARQPSPVVERPATTGAVREREA
jgi:drug/metabolite transporter (DMT)-like permease